MNKRLFWVGCLLGICLAGNVQAGGREKIAVIIDPGTSDRENKDMASWMGRDLSDTLSGRRGGYPTRILGSKDEFKQNAGEYLLDIRITRYNPGNKAARAFVGFGAGSASLDIHYELISPRGVVLMSKDDGCGSSLHWKNVAQKLNKNILESIRNPIAAGDNGAPVMAPRPEVVRPSVPVQAVSVQQPQSEAVAPAQPSVTTSAPAPAKDPVEQLRQLDNMKRQKLISDSEYKQKRKEILERL
ncbi:MAG: DUF4410 domain-containing protein [bacterium]